jgi:hypothetical protein
MGDFEFDIDLLISLVEAKPVLWGKTDDIYKDRNEKAWREFCICLQNTSKLWEMLKKRLC